jgi:hypothetical protein
MISIVRERIEHAVGVLTEVGKLKAGTLQPYLCNPPDMAEHGDMATNIAMANAPAPFHYMLPTTATRGGS